MSLIPSPVRHFPLHLTALLHPLCASACVGCGVHVPVSHIQASLATSFPPGGRFRAESSRKDMGTNCTGKSDRRRAGGSGQARGMCSGRGTGSRKSLQGRVSTLCREPPRVEGSQRTQPRSSKDYITKGLKGQAKEIFKKA